MLSHQFIILAITTTIALAQNQACFDLRKLSEQITARGIREKCQKELSPQAHTSTCFGNFRLCYLREMGVLNNYGNEVDHTKMVTQLQRYSTNNIATRLTSCSGLTLQGDKIRQYFDCIQGYCAEIANLRSAFYNAAKEIC